jgi:hypothetical protein
MTMSLATIRVAVVRLQVLSFASADYRPQSLRLATLRNSIRVVLQSVVAFAPMILNCISSIGDFATLPVEFSYRKWSIEHIKRLPANVNHLPIAKADSMIQFQPMSIQRYTAAND